MAISDVLRVMRQVKSEGVVKDFMIFGSVAAMAHTRPFFTQDVDIAIAVDSDEEYAGVLTRLRDYGTVTGFAVVINGTAAELFPSDISPIIADAFVHSMRRRVGGEYVKVARPEHLVLEALRAARPADRARVLLLNEAVDPSKLDALFERLDADGTLRRNFQRITG